MFDTGMNKIFFARLALLVGFFSQTQILYEGNRILKGKVYNPGHIYGCISMDRMWEWELNQIDMFFIN